MAVIAPDKPFVTDRTGILIFHNLVSHYNASASTPVVNPFSLPLTQMENDHKFITTFSNDVFTVLEEVASTFSAFGTESSICINRQGDTQPAYVVADVVLGMIKGDTPA